jgi:hypothetical protein
VRETPPADADRRRDPPWLARAGGPGFYVAAPVPGALTKTPSGVRFVCRYERMCTGRKQPTPKLARRKLKSRSIKSGFEEVANGWLLLAEQMEWIDRQRSLVRDEENNRSVR